MKQCPSCNRTYSDESISFCLADGALLSAPYDSLRTAAPPTENLNSARVEVAPTQPARPAASTMTSLPSAHKYQPNGIEGSKPKQSALTWIGMVLALVMVVVAVLTVRFFVNRQNETVAAVAAQPSPVQASPAQASPAQASPSQAATKPTATPSAELAKSAPRPTLVTPAPAKSSVQDISPGQAGELDADPVLFQPKAKQPSEQSTSAEDYNRIFSGREVTSKARVLSKPDPTYTEEARQNQISGTVVLRVVMSANGEVTNIHAVSGLPYGLTERAIAAAKQVKFVPATKDGHSVSMWMELQYNFNLY